MPSASAEKLRAISASPIRLFPGRVRHPLSSTRGLGIRFQPVEKNFSMTPPDERSRRAPLRPYRFGMRTHTVEHPLAAALLTTLRDARTPNAAFRAALRDLTRILVYEALREAPVTRFEISTPVA